MMLTCTCSSFWLFHELQIPYTLGKPLSTNDHSEAARLSQDIHPHYGPPPKHKVECLVLGQIGFISVYHSTSFKTRSYLPVWSSNDI
jgi:hypothetical protein